VGAFVVGLFAEEIGADIELNNKFGFPWICGWRLRRKDSRRVSDFLIL
jgi:hypothetical protein